MVEDDAEEDEEEAEGKMRVIDLGGVDRGMMG